MNKLENTSSVCQLVPWRTFISRAIESLYIQNVKLILNIHLDVNKKEKEEEGENQYF